MADIEKTIWRAVRDVVILNSKLSAAADFVIETLDGKTYLKGSPVQGEPAKSKILTEGL